MTKGIWRLGVLGVAGIYVLAGLAEASGLSPDQERKKRQMETLQKRFEWWPTDAKPDPVKDTQRGGYWWWPNTPGRKKPWGNRGYVYVYKIIFDYRAEELPPPQSDEIRSSLLIKRIIKNVKIYFDYDKSELRDDAARILEGAVASLRRNPETSILITGNADVRGSEAYNEKLGRRRAEAVKVFMLRSGISEGRIRIVSRGKLDAVAPVNDLVGMQKDRNAHFMVAEVTEMMLPYSGLPSSQNIRSEGKGKYVEEEKVHLESAVKVSTRDYVIQKGDTLSKIAQTQLGKSHRWPHLYEMNRDRLTSPDRLRVGQKILVPVE